LYKYVEKIGRNTSKIKTTNGQLIGRWNKRFITLRDGYNNISLSGNFTLKLSYRLPIRVGA
jgi:hypothetical protein